MKKRIFVSTGSISLVNILSILNQKTNQSEFCDDLVVVSFAQSREFVETTKKIAKLHKFNQIKFMKTYNECKKNINFNLYDEAYIPAFESFFDIINKHKNSYIIDEGPGFVKIDARKITNAKGCYINKFLNKFSYVGLNDSIKVNELNIDDFKTISKKILKLFEEKEDLDTDKNILFIGHYIYRKLGDEVALDFYKKYINYFIEKGYTVYFKAHPRDNDVLLPILKDYYSNNSNFMCMNNSLPIEIYDYNFDMVVGSYSGTLISLPHYRNIPSINLPLKELYNTNVGYKFKQFFAIYDEYTPNFEEMKDVIGQPFHKIQERYSTIMLAKKPIWKNDRIIKIIFWTPNVIKDIFFGFLSIFCLNNKSLTASLRHIAKSDLYNMLNIAPKKFNKKSKCLLEIKKDTKCLLVAPHPDDDTIGVGGILLKYSKNFDCICLGSSGVELEEPHVTPKERSEMRIEEFHNVMNLLEIQNHWIFETYGVPRFDDQMEEHFEKYCETLKDLKKYDYIFLPHPCDGHHEHRFITNTLFKKLIKTVGYNKCTKIVFYEVWDSIQFPNTFFELSNGGFLYSKKIPRFYQESNSNIEIKDDDSLLDKKIEYSKLYKSQWDYDNIYQVNTIQRSLKTGVERYRVISIEKYLKLISFSFSYGII